MKKATCRGCGAPIVWIRTTGGKSMPCDAQPVLYKERKGAAGKIVTPNGEVLSCDLDVEPDEATGVGYISHFVTCPQAEQFRKKGAPKDGGHEAAPAPLAAAPESGALEGGTMQ